MKKYRTAHPWHDSQYWGRSYVGIAIPAPPDWLLKKLKETEVAIEDMPRYVDVALKHIMVHCCWANLSREDLLHDFSGDLFMTQDGRVLTEDDLPPLRRLTRKEFMFVIHNIDVLLRALVEMRVIVEVE
jgi:hypothetical protein